MTKKEYMQPTIALDEFDMAEQLLAYSLHASGLGDDDLTQDETPGDSWNDAMSRKAWDDDEE